jgi:hypothetical protein
MSNETKNNSTSSNWWKTLYNNYKSKHQSDNGDIAVEIDDYDDRFRKKDFITNKDKLQSATGLYESRSIKGLLDNELIEEFFNYNSTYTSTTYNHYGQGHYRGRENGTPEAKQNGHDSIKSKFEAILDKLIERLENEKSYFEKQLISSQGTTNGTEDKLKHNILKINREIDRLKQEKVNCNQGKGLVKPAIQRHDEGFDDGVNSRVNFDRLIQS